MTLSEEEYADASDSELLRLIKASDWNRVRSTLESELGPTDVLSPDKYGNLPLHAALGYRAPDDLILTVLEMHPDATSSHGTDNWLPLHIAAMWGASPAVVEALIRKHPRALDDAGSSGIKGRTPRHFSGRFHQNTELLDRPTEDWIRLIEEE